MSKNHSSKGIAFATAVIGVITALVSLAGNFYQYRSGLAEAERRKAAEDSAEYAQNRAKWAEEKAQEERKAREKVERQQDSIHKFMVNYRTHLLEIRNAYARLKEVKASQVRDSISEEKNRQLEEDLILRVKAFTKFLNDWREVHRAIRPFLNGDADALGAAGKARDVTEIERWSRLLERNIDDKQRVLEEAVKTLQLQ